MPEHGRNNSEYCWVHLEPASARMHPEAETCYSASTGKEGTGTHW